MDILLNNKLPNNISQPNRTNASGIFQIFSVKAPRFGEVVKND